MAIRRFYCSEVVDKETNKVEYHFKEAKKKKYVTFKTQREAVRHVKEMKIDAMVWFRQNGQFVSSFKTLKSATYDKTDDIEIVEVKAKESKKLSKSEEVLASSFDDVDNVFLTSEADKAKKTATKPVKISLDENVATNVESKKPVRVAKGFFETAKQETYFWTGVFGLLLLTLVLVVLVIFAIFLNLI